MTTGEAAGPEPESGPATDPGSAPEPGQAAGDPRPGVPVAEPRWSLLARASLFPAMLLLVVAVAIAAGRLAAGRARDAVAAQTAASVPLTTGSLAAVIEKERLVPLVLSRDPEVIALLAGATPAAAARLDTKLAGIAEEAGATVIYVIGRDGTTLSASNAGEPESFVGSNYGFRSYFTEAMAEGSAQQYALGTVSRRPGLYLSRRVDSVLGPLGVVVLKVEFEPLEAQWRDTGLIVQVVDRDGVVLVTTNPAWRFGTTRPLVDEAATRASLQLDDRPMPPVPAPGPGSDTARIGGELHLATAGLVGPSAPDWTLVQFAPVERALSEARWTGRAVAFPVGLLLALAVRALMRRRRGTLARQRALAGLNAELERRVTQRTEELNRTNSALTTEMAEREAAETRVRHLRDELAQANRLSILGQVSAGVAHEINQPVAAIRTYADTGARLLDAGHAGAARENFGEIVRVTERIGAITQMLRGFARRKPGQVGPMSVDEAVDGALTLLAGRVRDAGVAIERSPPQPAARVFAGRIRLEQVLVNLLQNALDAVRDVPGPRIVITVTAGPSAVTVTVSDNGPGVSPETREHLFMPFTTTKEVGLGLGLVISADIAREFGGSLRLETDGAPAGPGGAAFTLELPRVAA